jgi:hypothetical protein
MAELDYLNRITEVISQIHETQKDNIEKAAPVVFEINQVGRASIYVWKRTLGDTSPGHLPALWKLRWILPNL